MRTAIGRFFLILVAALSIAGIVFDIKSPQIRQWVFKGSWEFELRTSAQNYFVRLEEVSPALKVLTISDDVRSRHGPKIADIIGHENLMTAPSVSVPCENFPLGLNNFPRERIKFASEGLTTWEALRLAYETRRFLSPAQIFFFEWPKDKSAAAELRRLWQAPINSAAAAKEGNFYFEILNASGEPGLALKVTRLLRQNQANFDVLSYGNTDLNQATSALHIHQSNLSLAKRVLVSLNKIMGIELIQKISPNKSRGVDFSLILADNARALGAKLTSFDFIDE